uniref:Uncharacterized protein n=1 Tax=Gopherus agassizii TaxID=38772 RepID=A0A452HH36_9SAUR
MAASARCAAEPRVLLGLRDAAIPDPARDSLQPPSWATSTLGGSPVRGPRTGVAAGARRGRAVQLYCPLEGSLFHRVINVFACAMKGCWGKSESWKVLRSQYLQMHGKETQDCKLKQNNFVRKDWCDGADDWGICDETEYPVQTTSHLLGLNTVSKISDSLHRPVPCGDGIAMPTSCPRFQSYYINVGVDLELLMSESFLGEGDNEKYEKSEVKNRDHVFRKFMKRISACHEQILRYFDNLDIFLVGYNVSHLLALIFNGLWLISSSYLSFQSVPTEFVSLITDENLGDRQPCRPAGAVSGFNGRCNLFSSST